MTRGDIVNATYMPHLGIGVIELTAGDRAHVCFEVDGRIYRDDFHIDELHHAKPTLARTA